MNLVLFTLKPIFSQTIRHCKHKCLSLCCNRNGLTNAADNGNNNGEDIVDDIIQRSYVLHKRPYLKWKRDDTANTMVSMLEIESKHRQSGSMKL